MVDTVDDVFQHPEFTERLCGKLDDVVKRAILDFDPESNLEIQTEVIDFECG